MQPPSSAPSPKQGLSAVVATRFRGCIVRCDVPRDDVARLLPAGIHVGRAPRVARGRHPLIFIFGEHDGSALLFASLSLPTGVRFYEMVIAVPYVHATGNTDPAVYLPRVFTTEPVITWSGNAHYGYSKRMVPIERLGSSYVVSDEAGMLLAHAVVEPAGAWQAAATSPLAAFPAALGAMPVLGAREGGSIVRSHFEWTFDRSWVRRVHASMSIDAPLGRGIERGTHRAVDTASVQVWDLGWRLSWPEPQLGSAS